MRKKAIVIVAAFIVALGISETAIQTGIAYGENRGDMIVGVVLGIVAGCLTQKIVDALYP